MKKVVIGLLAAIAVIIVLAIAAGGCGGSQKTTPAPVDTPKQSAPKHHEPSERADLTSFTIADKSVPGLADIWVKYTITNHSSKMSDYVIDWEAVSKKDGTRLANSTEYVNNVRPGQVSKGSMPTVLETANVKINITGLDRTLSVSP